MTFTDVTLLAGGQNWLAWIVLGAIAGFITKRIMGGSEGFITETILGIVGAVVAAFVASYFLQLSLSFFPSLIVAVIGAIVLVAIWRAFDRSRGRTSRI